MYASSDDDDTKRIIRSKWLFFVRKITNKSLFYISMGSP